MTTLSLKNVRSEILEVLRNGNILTTTIRGVTTRSDSFTATAGQTDFILTFGGVKNIRSVLVNSVAQKFITNYSYTSSGVVTLVTGATLSEPVVIQYDYGTSDKIYPDYARDDLAIESFPRVAIGITSSNSQPFQLGGGKHLTEVLVTIYAYMPVKKQTSLAGGKGGMDDLNNLITSIRDVIRTNEKSFVTFPFITPMGVSPAIPSTNNAIIQMSADFNCKFIIE